MWKQISLAAMLVGCTSTPPVTVPVIVEVPVYHPSMPVPYSVCNVVWEVLRVENLAKVAVSYNDNLTLAICLEDVERYISQLKNVACYYRQDLKEYICSKEQHVSK